MSTPRDYRALAEECFRWAQQAQTEDKRQAYLDVARTWLEAASGQGPSHSDTNPVAAQSEALMGEAEEPFSVSESPKQPDQFSNSPSKAPAASKDIASSSPSSVIRVSNSAIDSDFSPLCFSLKSDNLSTMTSRPASIRKAVRNSSPCRPLIRL